jgi:fumarate reductase subunit C
MFSVLKLSSTLLYSIVRFTLKFVSFSTNNRVLVCCTARFLVLLSSFLSATPDYFYSLPLVLCISVSNHPLKRQRLEVCLREWVLLLCCSDLLSSLAVIFIGWEWRFCFSIHSSVGWVLAVPLLFAVVPRFLMRVGPPAVRRHLPVPSTIFAF